MRLDHSRRLRAYGLDSCHVNEGFCHVGLGAQGHMGCWGSEWYCSSKGECTGEGCGEMGVLVGKLQDSSLPMRKRKATELKHETYIVGLHCRKELPEGVKVDDVHKVETETLLGYKAMASNVKTDEKLRFSMLMSEMINKRHDKGRILSKRVKLESLGYTNV
nr:hypothetical protein [Tanacetum cinerariifolium]